MTSEPASATALAVVVASNRGVDLLRACVDALLPQCKMHDARLIVVRMDGEDLDGLRRTYPDIMWVSAHVGDDIPQLRGRGLAVSPARLTALTEDHCVPASDWLARVLVHTADDAAVIGGGMGNLRPRAIDWAAYFSEYGFFDAARPDSAGMADGVPLLTGANVVYRDSIRELVTEWMLAGAWENTVHRRLAARGDKMTFDGSMRVSQNRLHRFLEFCNDRYEHGLDYAGTRTRDSSLAVRVVHAAVTPVLPLLLTWRVASAAGRAHAAAFTRALPATFAFLFAWSVGEAAGYLRKRSS